MMRKLVCALNPGVADMTYFFGVEEFPFFIVEFVVELDNKLGVDEVEKSVTNIAVVLNRKN